MIWLYIILFFVLLFCWILIAPVIMRVDSSNQRYRVMLPGIFSVSVVPSKEKIFFIRLWIFFIPVTIDPFRMMKKNGDSEDKARKNKQKRMKIFTSSGK